jgi:hypothetical protein
MSWPVRKINRISPVDEWEFRTYSKHQDAVLHGPTPGDDDRGRRGDGVMPRIALVPASLSRE